jgi:hypothetical protein
LHKHEAEIMAKRMDAPLDSRTARQKLAAGLKHWKGLEPGLALGYRRASQGPIWYWRALRGRGSEQYDVFSLRVKADDKDTANNKDVLSFAQARNKVLELYRLRGKEAAAAGGPISVKRAVEDYVSYLKAHKKTGADAEQRLARHVLPKLGHRLVAELTTRDIEAVQRAMVRHDPDPESVRKSKDTANRTMSYFARR